MKILQVVHGFPPRNRAGTEIFTYDLSKELNKNHEVYVFYPIADPDKKPYSLSYGSYNGLKIIEININKYKCKNIFKRWLHLFNFEHTYKDKRVEAKFEEVLEEVKPDFVHFHHLIGLSASLIKIAKDRGIPTILTLHDYWFACPLIQLLNYRYEVCEKPGKNCHLCWNSKQADLLSNFLTKFQVPKSLSKKIFELILNLLQREEKFKERKKYFKNLLLMVDKIIAPSKFLRKIFIIYGIPEEKIIYSRHGHDLSKFKGFKKKSSNKLRFGFCGGISKHKGIDTLIKAFNGIKKTDVELRIYGDYNINSPLFKEFMKKIKDNPNIKFFGGYKNPKIPFSEIDVLVFPSIWHETGSPTLVVAEAFATKTPVLSSDVGDLSEFIQNGKNGFLFEMGNSSDLTEKMQIIVKNPKLLDELKKNLPSVKSIEQQAKELEKIYREII